MIRGFPHGSAITDLPARAGDVGLIPGWGRSSGDGHSSPLQYSCLEKPMDEEPGRLWSIGSQRVKHDYEVTTHTKRWFNICKSLSEVHHTTTKGKK